MQITELILVLRSILFKLVTDSHLYTLPFLLSGTLQCRHLVYCHVSTSYLYTEIIVFVFWPNTCGVVYVPRYLIYFDFISVPFVRQYFLS